MRTHVLLGSIAALSLAGPALAADFSYSYVELGWVNSELDDLDVDGDGFAIRGSFGFTRNLHAFAAYSDQDFDFDVKGETLELGLGYAWPLTGNLDLVGRVSYLRTEAEVDLPVFGSLSVEDDGFGVGALLRGRIAERLELAGGFDYVNFDDGGDDVAASLGALYYFTRIFAAGANVQLTDDGTAWTIGACFDFGR